MESDLQGEEVAIPNDPVEVKVEVAVDPKYAVYAERIVDDARLNCCRPDHVFAFERLSEATTAPEVGEMVRVESTFDTEETDPAVERHVPPIE